MSPVIPDFFVALKSMQNAQALDHTYGIAKYVCKYITTFDQGNYVPIQLIRRRENLSIYQQMITNQCLTYQSHDGKTSQYDMISIFSLRPPELLDAFRNPVDYSHFCHIEKK